MPPSILDTPNCRPILELGVGTNYTTGTSVPGQWDKARWQGPGTGTVLNNMLINPAMTQAGTGGLAYGWTIPNRPASCTTTLETVGAGIPPFQRIVVTLAAAQEMVFQQQVTGVVGGVLSRFRADVKGVPAGSTFQLRVRAFHAGNGLLGQFSAPFTLGGSWATRQLDFTMPANTAYVDCQCVLTGAATNATLDVDACVFGVLEKSSLGLTNTWAGTEPTWSDISCDVINVDTFIGRERAVDPIEVGTMQVTVRNDDGTYDVNSDQSMLTVRPGRQIRLGVFIEHDTAPTWLWRGWVDGMTPSYLPEERLNVVTFDCIDSLGEAGRPKLVAKTAPENVGQSASDRINTVLDLVKWSADRRQINAVATTLNGTTYGAGAIDELTKTAESCGGAVYADPATGNIVFEGIGWQSYATGTPPDYGIGNGPAGPSSPALAGFLYPITGRATTPDSANLQITGDIVITAKVSKNNIVAGSDQMLVGQLGTTLAWSLLINAAGTLVFNLSDTPVGNHLSGKNIAVASAMAAEGIVNGADFFIGVTLDVDNGASGFTAQAITSTDGITWRPFGFTRITAGAPYVGLNSADVLTIGADPVFLTPPWAGRVYWVEMRTGLVPGSGTSIFRFDANEYPTPPVTPRTDPRGRVWTLTTAAAITPSVPAGALQPADVCPEGWEISYLRSETPTQVVIGRAAVTGEPTPPVPTTIDDIANERIYGVETWSKVDLLTQDAQILLTVGNRTLKAFGANSAPRVKSVVLQPGRGERPLRLCATASPFIPTRYRCRLITDERTVFDRQMFVTSVRHSLDAGKWSTVLGLDDATAFAVVG